jgi:hypothetical protein
MTELHPTNGGQVMSERSSKAWRVTKTNEQRSTERTSDRDPLRNRSIRWNWEMFWIWSFLVFCFAAFFFCFYAILAKLHGTWPF